MDQTALGNVDRGVEFASTPQLPCRPGLSYPSVDHQQSDQQDPRNHGSHQNIINVAADHRPEEHPYPEAERHDDNIPDDPLPHCSLRSHMPGKDRPHLRRRCPGSGPSP